jgi:hypothetical protein
VKQREVGKFEYRLICADPTHKMHRYHAGVSLPKAMKKAQANNADPVCDPATCVPMNRTCRPWRIEARFVTEWTDEIDHLEMASAAYTLQRELAL